MEVIVGLQTDIGLAVYVGCLLPGFTHHLQYSPVDILVIENSRRERVMKIMSQMIREIISCL